MSNKFLTLLQLVMLRWCLQRNPIQRSEIEWVIVITPGLHWRGPLGNLCMLCRGIFLRSSFEGDVRLGWRPVFLIPPRNHKRYYLCPYYLTQARRTTLQQQISLSACQFLCRRTPIGKESSQEILKKRLPSSLRKFRAYDKYRKPQGTSGQKLSGPIICER